MKHADEWSAEEDVEVYEEAEQVTPCPALSRFR